MEGGKKLAALINNLIRKRGLFFMERVFSKTRKGHLGLLFTMTLVFVFALCLCTSAKVNADCGVSTGPTQIFQGMATGEKDITVYNDEIAFALAVDSNNYWNMTKGSILDIGIRGAGGVDGDFGVDLVNDVEFLNDLWTATGTYNDTNLLTDVTVEVTENTPEKVVVVSTTRYWVKDADKNGTDDDKQFGAEQKPLDVVITYTLEDGNNYIGLTAVVKNPADNQVTYANMYSGFSISTLAASMFGPFGYYPDLKTTGIRVGSAPDVQEYFGDFVTTYSNNYAVSLQMDETDAYKGSSGYKDIYKLQDLEPGKTYDFTGEVFVSDESETATLMNRMIDKRQISDAATISGRVVDNDGNPVAGAYVIAEKNGVYQQTKASADSGTAGHVAGTVVANMQPLVWDITDDQGNYSFTLPTNSFSDGLDDVEGNGTYEYKFKIEAAGYTSILSDTITLTENKDDQNFTLEAGANVVLKAQDENGFSIPFKVNISGITSEMKTLGGTTYFSNAMNTADPYTISFNMTKANDVTFSASYGGNYESKVTSYTTDVTEKGVTHTFTIPTAIDPEEKGWYCADNHQHSDYGDGATTIQNLLRAQIAAKLDFALVADHDTRIHNTEMAKMASKLGIPFLSNIEVSPGWGHWGYLGVAYGEGQEGAPLDPSTATPQEIVKKGHELGATVIVHHPYSDYGYLNNQASVNGGKDPGWDSFDLLELQSTMSLKGFENFLTADVWQQIDYDDLSGSIKGLEYTDDLNNIDVKALITAMAFWNQGDAKYFSAGSDQHDAYSATLYPGIIRMYALLGDGSNKAKECTTENYIEAVNAGHSYVTMGPILLPDENTVFGTERRVNNGDKIAYSMEVEAVNGLASVSIWSNNGIVETKTFENVKGKQKVTFEVTPTKDNTWYSFTANDASGNSAVSNPCWVTLVSANVFSDVPNSHWASDAINTMAAYGFVDGYPGSESKFMPNENITRAEFCKIIAGIEDFEATTTASFNDVKEGQWFYASVMELANAGIIKGYGEGVFAPNQQISREEMFTIIARAAGLDEVSVPAKFSDIDKVKSWAKGAINALYAKGAVNGYPDNTLRPQANATRAEATQILYNAFVK